MEDKTPLLTKILIISTIGIIILAAIFVIVASR
jgi:subtilase family serine protease